MFGGDGFAGTYNNDVLEAEVSQQTWFLFHMFSMFPFFDSQPATEEAKLNLVEEIKNRAKGCISSRNFPEAIRLYGKGIELSSENLPAKAILHANRSMCYLNMNNGTNALDDAQTAIKTDSTYIKGVFAHVCVVWNH